MCTEDYLKEIYKKKRLFEKQHQDVEDAKEIEKILSYDLYETIKSYTTIYDICYDYILKAQEELSIKDKRRKKENLKWLERRISEDFFDNRQQIKITSILFYSLYNEAIHIYFNLGDKQYYIGIPIKKNLPYYSIEDKFNYVLSGKFALFEVDGSLHTCMESSYDIESLREYILNNIIT